MFTLTGADGSPYASALPGLLGGHRRRHGYGRLDCPAALRWIARGHYVRFRVFFADEPAAVAAGYRPCAACLPERYAQWKAGGWPPRDARAVTGGLGDAAGGGGVGRTLGAPGVLGAAPGVLGAAPGVLSFLRARAVPGVEALDGAVYRRALSLPHGPALVEIEFGSGGTEASVHVLAADSRDRATAEERCRALLGLDADWDDARAALSGDPLLGPLIAARPGLLVPGTVDGAELAVRAIVNQQVSLAAARKVLGRVVASHGQPVRHLTLRPFPSAERLARADPESLPMPRARARALVAVCRAIASGDLDLRPGADPTEARAALLAVPGIGDWTASYVAMRALRDRDAFLPTDLGIRRALESLGQKGDHRSAAKLAERWRPWRTYAAQLLWAHAAESTRVAPPPRRRLRAG